MDSRTSAVGAIVLAAAACAGCASKEPPEVPPARNAARSEPPAMRAEGRVRSLAVGTFNIRLDTASDGANAWPNRVGLVVDVLGAADVWGIQEALPNQVQELSRRLQHMDVVWRTRDEDPGRDESCPILYDRRVWSLDPDDHGTFWLSEDPSVPGSKSWDSSLPRICTYVRLVRRGDSSCAVYVFNVHLDHRGEVAREQSARLVRSRIAARRHADPVVLLGDFNAGPNSAPLRLLTVDTPAREPAQAMLRDSWRIAHPQAPEQGTFNGWSHVPEGPRIDFVLVSPGIRVLSASIDSAQRQGRWPSDHLPVTALIELPCSAPIGHAAAADRSPQ